ncbi:DUF4214 domain-containing protein, partial [Roseibium sp. SCP14]|uniref:DUF4214 domain-containing protein n=1 Tax=Roseibium sp. SCP14 TaxID=3141375 RepID=UPI00333C66CF
MANGEQAEIRSLAPGDHVLSFDPLTEGGKGALIPQKVVRIFENITEEWLRLTWVEGGEEKELVTTPGHQFLAAHGGFKEIESLVTGGKGTVVLADGSEVEVTSERIVYSAATADMFEQAEGYVYPENGNLVLKPVYKKGWKTYNFEVEDFHTYVAGGVRVHNDSWSNGEGFEYESWRSRDGTATVELMDGSHVPLNGEDVLNFRIGLPESYRNTPDAHGDSLAFGMAKDGGFSNKDIYYASWREYTLHRGGATSEPITDPREFSRREAKIAQNIRNGENAASSGGDQNSNRDSEGSRVDTSRSQSTSDRGIGTGDYDRDGEVDAREFRRAERDGEFNTNKSSSNKDSDGESGGNGGGGGKPVLLDLDGDGIEVTALDRSTVFMDTGGDGFLHRTAWAGEGDGILFYDPDGRDEITEKRQFVFTEWDPTATSDLEALASVFDTNNNGVLDAGDDEFGKFKVMVTNEDGSTTSYTLSDTKLGGGITEIDLTADATNIELSDGSVITGKTTFKRADGTTGTVGDMLLAAEAQGHRVEQVESVDGSGTRTLVSTAYAADGSKAYEIHSVTSDDGLSITNRYDDNGDGVTDRIQTIVTVKNADGSRVETESNFAGSNEATAVLTSRTETTTFENPLTGEIDEESQEIILRDSSGGGWFDQRENRSFTDGSLTIVITDLAYDNSEITRRSETVSVNGSVRIDGSDLDGDGLSDTIVNHTVTTHADDSRTETIATTNRDGSLRSHVTEEVGADNRSKEILRDLDGDGVDDTHEILDIVVAPTGQTTSTLTIRNHDGSLRSSSTTVQSEDALSKTTEFDLDGDEDFDLTVVDATTVHADGSRERLVTEINDDDSVRTMRKETLGADKVSQEVFVDLDQNGNLEAKELVSSVVVNATTQERIATNWSRNADGSVNAKSVSTTSADGLTTETKTDLDGSGESDSDFDVTVKDVTTVNGDGSSTRTVTTDNQDNSLRTVTTIVTSADGLTTTTTVDVDGDGQIEEKTVEALVLEADGGTTRTTSNYAGDGTSLLSRTIVEDTADRRTRTVTTDRDGDGKAESISERTEGADGAINVVETSYGNDGTVLGEAVTSTSANGLVSSRATDLDGDQVADVTVKSTTVLNADGSRTIVERTENGDQSLRSTSTVNVSDNGLVTETSIDADGNGVYERIVSDVTVLDADGGTTRTVESRSQSGLLLNRTQTEISDDQLVTVIRTDTDGDDTDDLIEEVTRVLQSDGSTVTTTELSDASETLRSSSKQTVSDNGRSIETKADVNGDGEIDVITTQTIADDGEATTKTQHLAANGDLQSQSRTITSANGLSTTTETDRDGDETYETLSETVRTLNADGSETVTTSFEGKDGTLQGRTVSTLSDDGLRSDLVEDLDGDGANDLTTVSDRVISDDGTVTTTETAAVRDGSLLRKTVETVDGDGKSSSRKVYLNGNETYDQVMETTLDDDGTTTTVSSYYSETDELLSRTTARTSGNGLETVTSFDLDGNESTDRVMRDVTSIAADGTSTRTITHETGQGSLLAREHVLLSDDGYETTTSLDLDGFAGNDFITTKVTDLVHDGSTVETWTSRGDDNNVVGSATRTASGDGLSVAESRDFDGDGDADRATTVELGAAGGSTETVSQYGSGTNLLRQSKTVVTEDERTITTTVDKDGDGGTDLEINTQIDLSGNEATTWTDFGVDGPAEAIITKTASANGTAQTYSLDVDGDGNADITRKTTVSYDDAGNEVRVFEESNAVGGLAFTSTTVTSANGYTSETSVDSDGDGETDSTGKTEAVFAADGSRTTTSRDWHDDGSLRSSYVETVSADGRTVTETFDFDGDHKTDKVRVSETAADGSRTVTETGYGETMADAKTSVTETSSDGLTTTIFRDGVTQTISRSPVGNSSYDWDNGVTASASEAHITVSHKVDAQGFETWEMRSTQNGVTTTWSERFDAASKARLLAEAARIYDSVLDRDMDLSEIEVLVQYTKYSQLNLTDLADALLSSDEYSARYGDLTDTGFIARAYQNTFGREPTLDELAEHLAELSGSTTRAQIIAELSESAEHLVVGNSQGETNNHNVFLLPEVAEDALRASFGVSGFDMATDEADVKVGTDAGETLSIGSNDALFGRAGNDTLGGSSNTDILVGGTGNDTLNGGAGDDIYVYNRGDGNDTINDTGSGSNGDTLRFGQGIELEDLKLTRSGNNLKIEFHAENSSEQAAAAADGLAPLTGSIIVKDWFTNSAKRIDRVAFDNGDSYWIGHLDSFQTAVGDVDSDAYLTDVTWASYENNGIHTASAQQLLTLESSRAPNWQVEAQSINNHTGKEHHLYVYEGQMFVVEGTTYTFKEDTDDAGLLYVDNQFVLFDNDDDTPITGTYSATQTGFVNFKFYAHNNGNQGHSKLHIYDPETGYRDIQIYDTEVAAPLRVVYGTSGDNYLEANSVDSLLSGGNGHDVLKGREGDDKLYGGSGHDTLLGGGGDDRLYGGEGDDVLDAGEGSGTSWQYLYGQSGDDVYLYGMESGKVFINSSEGENDGTADTVRFKELNLADVTFDVHDATQGGTVEHVDGRSLRILWDNGTDIGELRIANMGEHIERFEFADGSAVRKIGLTEDGRVKLWAADADGSNHMVGTQLDDYLYGGAGDDTLDAGAGNDVLDAGASNGSWQYLRGYAGDDVYFYGREAGKVFINYTEGENDGTADTVRFKDLALADVTFAIHDYTKEGTVENADGKALCILWSDGTDSGELRIANMGEHIERFEFADGSAVRKISPTEDGWVKLWAADADGSNHMVGTQLDDYLYGGTGDDVLDAGASNGSWQYLRGYAGDDVYLYGREAGKVFINYTEGENDGFDTIRFKDLALADVTFAIHDYTDEGTVENADGEALSILWSDGTDNGEMRIANLGEHIERFEFADGTVVKEIKVRDDGSGINLWGTSQDSLIVGSADNDYIFAGNGNDILDAGHGSGWQHLRGYGGDDVYLYGTEAGKVFINYTEGENDGFDTIRFKDLTLADVTFAIHDYTDGGAVENADGEALCIRWDDGTDSGELRIANLGDHIERFEFADGTVVKEIKVRDDGNGINLWGTSQDSLIVGSADNDYIFAGNGNDILDAGAGNGSWQHLRGYAGDDVYLYGREAGKVFINYTEGENDGFDTIRFK